MKSFILKRYDIQSLKIPDGQTVKLMLIADLHGVCYEENQEKLVRVIRAHHPDAVLAAGDMICSRRPDSFRSASAALCRLAEFVPVYYGMGNHELVLMECESARHKKKQELYRLYTEYEEELAGAGVTILHNERRKLKVGEALLDIAGLDLPMPYYRKLIPKRLTPEELREYVGEADPEAFQVLIAHSPRFGDAYFDWEADLTVSGHYHGGLVRFGEHCGAVSPYYTIFPRYCVGGFARDASYLIVSSGLGEHSIQFRIHNPRELELITLYPQQETM